MVDTDNRIVPAQRVITGTMAHAVSAVEDTTATRDVVMVAATTIDGHLGASIGLITKPANFLLHPQVSQRHMFQERHKI